jgi:hypothetical protein
MTKQPDYWFPAKRVGWGWGLPSIWQGWLTLALYIAALLVGSVFFPPSQHGLAYSAVVAVATLCLLGICAVKGEPQRPPGSIR